MVAGSAAALRPALSAARAIAPQPKPAGPEIKPFELDEITISELQDGMNSGRFTARSLVEKYSGRIDDIDKRTVNAVIEMNPDAPSIAEALDAERKAKGPRGPLHGIPVLIKDNIDTADRMMTTAGSLALVGSKPPKDSFLAQQLRAAGAVILGKTNLSEWANIRSNHSVLEPAPAFLQTWLRSESVPRRMDRSCVLHLPTDWPASSRRSDWSADLESFPSPTARTEPVRCVEH